MIKSLSSKEIYDMISKNDDELYILDVRTPAEYKERHIKNAKLINVNDAEFENEINKLDKSKKYIVYCRSGVRSMKACEIMEKSGFKELYNLIGGITNWKNNGFPVEK
ncbi:rhodanese-like domain-containing protein [Methanothermococcus okinawensis]|uniref:Rhodanese-like protein n=1 Tax=Methanothermococcus okinawensis (strain DSM 14208 / JCM 11175 / IH1) TaxID=647113 RepID=F8AL23_METOI|nr:rhodanese-like domain-containing protein [Methanothermococcus okinawensis]AEH06459.1 Rhodanese-like protein [Methanothermococcus okinawensis IH1]